MQVVHKLFIFLYVVTVIPLLKMHAQEQKYDHFLIMHTKILFYVRTYIHNLNKN